MRGGRGGEPARPARTGGAGRDPEYRDAIPHHCSPPGCTHKHQLQFFYFMHFINKLFMPCLVCPLFDFLCSCRHTTQNLHYTLYIVNKGRRCNMLHSLVLKFQPVTSTSTNAKHTTVQSYSATRVMVCPCLPTSHQWALAITGAATASSSPKDQAPTSCFQAVSLHNQPVFR